MSSPVSSRRRLLFGEDALEGFVPGGVVGCAVLPAVPDDVQPGTGKDAGGVGVVFAAGDGIVVQPGGPGAGVAGVAGEVADGVAELLVGGPAEVDVGGLAGFAGGGGDPARQISDSGIGNWARQSPISASSRAARTVPERGSEVKMGASACKVSCSAIWASRALIWVAMLARTACRARVMCALAVPSSPAAPRGAAVRRACSTAGSLRPQ